METLDDLYLHFDGCIPSSLYDAARVSDIQTYTRQIARAAERQFETIIQETQTQICHYRMIQEPIFSTATLGHLSNQISYHRNRAVEARNIQLKNAA